MKRWVLVAVDLGALRLLEGVLDGQLVQAELLADDVELFSVGSHRSSQITQPWRSLQLVGDLVGRKVLFDQLAVAVEAGVRMLPWCNPASGRGAVG